MRYQGLDMDDDAFPLFADPTRSVSRARGFGVATLFAFNRRVRFALNYHPSENRPQGSSCGCSVQVKVESA